MICYPEADIHQQQFLVVECCGKVQVLVWDMADVSDILIRDFMQLNPVNMDFRGWEMHPFQAKVRAESKKGL